MPVWLRNDARLLPALLSKEGEKIGPEKNPGGFRKFLLGLQKRVHEPKGKGGNFLRRNFQNNSAGPGERTDEAFGRKNESSG